MEDGLLCSSAMTPSRKLLAKACPISCMTSLHRNMQDLYMHITDVDASGLEVPAGNQSLLGRGSLKQAAAGSQRFVQP